MEFTTLKGDKFFLDFLALMSDDTLCHVEFQYPHAKPGDNDRFFKYNISAEVRHQKRAETYIFNFDFKKIESNFKKMGKTKCFSPINFNLEGIDFNEFIKNINIKVKSNKELSHDEEIMLVLIPVIPEFNGDVEVLNWVSMVLSNRELFDESKYEFIRLLWIWKLKIFLLLMNKIKSMECYNMTPHAEKVVLKVIREVNQKVLNESEQKGIKKGVEEGIEKGKLDIAKNMVEKGFSMDTIVEITGLTMDEIISL